MKKISIIVLLILSCVLISCKKKPEKLYTGSVMMYSTLPNDVLKTIKLEFENKHRGVTLDYYYSSEDRVEELLDNEKSTGEFDADVVFGFDMDTFSRFKGNDYFESYKSKESKKIDQAYIDSENAYTGVAKYRDDKNKEVVACAGLLKNSPSMENGQILIDFLLSEKCSEIFSGKDMLSLRK